MSKNMFKYDIYRHYGKKETLLERIIRPLELKYLYYMRSCNLAKNRFLKLYYRFKLRRLSEKTNIQIDYRTKIGKGFYIGHCGRIIINPNAVLGDNINIATGVTIGKEYRGKRKGCPKIGNYVWIGTNAVIVGNISIGDDVLIAPLSYVNFNVPSHSIVLGNPGNIIPNQNATKGYINRTV